MNYTGKSGVQYNLSKILASGGEGEIYDIAGKPDCVAKIYKSGKANSEKENKLLKMANDPPNQSMLKQIAWPQDVLYDGSNFVGFIMPKLEINEDLNVIYEYGSTAKYQKMSWENRIIIAENLCAVLEAIHFIGHVCGDLNPKNITVNPNTGFVVFLDTDSYHIQDGSKTYRCDVGIPEYLPVEVQKKMRGGNTLATVNPSPFSKETDNFALAIHIFQLLMNGVHPFACAIIPGHSSVAAPQPNDNIEKGMFPFMQDVQGIKIPTFAPEIVILPDNLQKLFRLAFIDGHNNPNDRPKPQEWRTALSSLRQQGLKTCSQVQYHQFNKLLVNCPWCKADKAYNDFLNKSYVPPAQVQIATPTAPNIPVTSPRPTVMPRTVTPPRPPTVVQQPPYTAPKESSSGPIIFIGLVLIIIIVIAMSTNGSNNTPQNPQPATQPTTNNANIRFVNANGLNVRSSPQNRGEANRIESITRNTRVEIIERNANGWVRIRYGNGKIGWVDGSFLSTTQTPAPRPTTTTANTWTMTFINNSSHEIKIFEPGDNGKLLNTIQPYRRWSTQVPNGQAFYYSWSPSNLARVEGSNDTATFRNR